jgi:hypothetical protein
VASVGRWSCSSSRRRCSLRWAVRQGDHRTPPAAPAGGRGPLRAEVLTAGHQPLAANDDGSPPAAAACRTASPATCPPAASYTAPPAGGQGPTGRCRWLRSADTVNAAEEALDRSPGFIYESRRRRQRQWASAHGVAYGAELRHRRLLAG